MVAPGLSSCCFCLSLVALILQSWMIPVGFDTTDLKCAKVCLTLQPSDGRKLPRESRSWDDYWASRDLRVSFPTEFIGRIFLGSYPGLTFEPPLPGSECLDLSAGDGRNSKFLHSLGYRVTSTEISENLVGILEKNLSGLLPEVVCRVARNGALPFDDEMFDVVVAAFSIYYLDEGGSLEANLREIARVLRPGGWFVCCVAKLDSYIFDGSTEVSATKGRVFRVAQDPYGVREGELLAAVGGADDLLPFLSSDFSGFSWGDAQNNYFGIDERVLWVVAQRNELSRGLNVSNEE